MVDAVAAVSGTKVDVYGHSFGAACALGGATLTSNVRRLAVYEPPVRSTAHFYPPGLLERIDTLLAQGSLEQLTETVFRTQLEMSDAEFEAFRSQPSWPSRVAAAHTIPRETRAELAGAFDIALAERITMPTLLLTGEHSVEFLKADIDLLASSLPDAQVVVLEGQEHVADVLDPKAFAVHLYAFLHDTPR